MMEQPDIELERDHDIYTLAWDGVRNLYFRTMNGVYKYSVDTKKTDRIYAEDYGQLDGGEGDFQTAMMYDPDGIL